MITGTEVFSYHQDAPLDMRMSSEGISAKDVVNSWSYEELRKILFEYGEEKVCSVNCKENSHQARGQAY